jgi:CRISPR-associated protein Cas2
MVVIILEKVPVRLRGELTRWLLELKAGVFVGKVSAMVRDKLWQRVCEGDEGRRCAHGSQHGYRAGLCISLLGYHQPPYRRL